MTDLPPTLDTPEFRAAWADWLAYRKERRWSPYKPIGLKTAIKRLAEHGPDAAIMAINHSMGNNYQGLFPDRFVGRQRFASRNSGAGEFSGAF